MQGLTSLSNRKKLPETVEGLCRMSPDAALQLQIELYRGMSGQQRLAIALDLHALACDLAREGIRRQFPAAGDEEVERHIAPSIGGRPPMRSQQELLGDCLGRLNRSGVSYMLTGSMASNYWGIPRTTHDLDFVLVMQPADVAGFVDAFREGFFLQPESVRERFDRPINSMPLTNFRR